MVNPLARKIMENNLKDSKPNIYSKKVDTDSNLENREMDMIKDIIKGDTEIVNTTNKNKAISLEEAVYRIKNKG